MKLDHLVVRLHTKQLLLLAHEFGEAKIQQADQPTLCNIHHILLTA